MVDCCNVYISHTFKFTWHVLFSILRYFRKGTSFLTNQVWWICVFIKWHSLLYGFAFLLQQGIPYVEPIIVTEPVEATPEKTKKQDNKRLPTNKNKSNISNEEAEDNPLTDPDISASKSISKDEDVNVDVVSEDNHESLLEEVHCYEQFQNWFWFFAIQLCN